MFKTLIHTHYVCTLFFKYKNYTITIHLKNKIGGGGGISRGWGRAQNDVMNIQLYDKSKY